MRKKQTSLGKLFKQKLCVTTKSQKSHDRSLTSIAIPKPDQFQCDFNKAEVDNDQNKQNKYHNKRQIRKQPKKQVKQAKQEQFNQFDIDMGVPYVQSKHLDSGFQFQSQKQHLQRSIQKKVGLKPEVVYSAKQIFQDLNISQKHVNISDLQIDVFTGDQIQTQQETQSQKILDDSISLKKNLSDKILFNYKVLQPTSFKKNQIYIENQNEKQLILKLKKSTQNRQQKLKKWNQKLISLQTPRKKSRFAQNTRNNQQNQESFNRLSNKKIGSSSKKFETPSNMASNYCEAKIYCDVPNRKSKSKSAKFQILKKIKVEKANMSKII